MMRFLAAVLITVALSGCMVGQRTTLPDADTDQLPDETEKVGWNLTIVKTLFTCFSTERPEPVLEVRFVSSNELRQDTDADGVSDLDEYFHNGDPRNADTDGDGLSDREEWDLRETPGFFHGPRLALNEVDSDEDCLTDFEEIRGSDIPGLGHRTSDPTIDDSDHDGFSDAWEFKRSFTDPLNADTDGDGANDRLDIDPLRDIWMRIEFTSLTLKQFPKDEARLQLHWSVPAKESQINGHSEPFNGRKGEQIVPSPGQMPGEFDAQDLTGQSTLHFEFWAYVLDSNDEFQGFLNMNPHNPSQPVKVQYDPKGDTWAFGTADGSYTEAGKSSALETSEARLTFLFEDFSLD